MPQHDDLGFQLRLRLKRRDHDVEEQVQEGDRLPDRDPHTLSDGVSGKDQRPLHDIHPNSSPHHGNSSDLIISNDLPGQGCHLLIFENWRKLYVHIVRRQNI